MIKGWFVKRQLVNGKWLTKGQVMMWLDNTVQNVILSGFDSPEDLYSIINKASGGSQTFNMQILEKLSGLYEDKFSSESIKYAIDPTNSPLLPLIIRQKSIILNACEIVTEIQTKAEDLSLGYDEEEDEDLEMIPLSTDEQCSKIKNILEKGIIEKSI